MFHLSLLITLLGLGCRSDGGVKSFNANPVATITSHENNSSALEGYTLQLRAQLSDSNHSTDQLLASWYLDDELQCDWAAPDGQGTSSCEIIPEIDSTTITVRTKDPEDAGGMDQINLIVEATEAPNSTITSPLPSGIYYGDQLLTFSGTISDQEDQPGALQAHWESSVDGLLSVVAEPESDGAVLGSGYLTAGEHFITLHVEDSSGKTGSSSVTIAVGPPNSPPSCLIVAPQNGEAAAAGELVILQGSATDVNIPADQLEVQWESDKDGILGTSTPTSTGEFSFAYSNLSVDTHSITMTVKDEVGATCSDAILYTIGTPPTVVIHSPQDQDLYNEGDSLVFSATVADNEDTPEDIALQWRSDRDGVLSTAPAPSNGEVQFAINDLSHGYHVITLVATDSHGLTSSSLIGVTVNGLPSQPSVSIAPNPAVTTDDLSASAAGSVDPEGQSVSYSFEWSNGATILSGATLPASNTAKGQTWTVTSTPTDGIASGPSASASMVIGNTNPSVSNVAISPSSPSVSDTLSCTATVSDPDETPTTSYQWTNATTGLDLGTGSTITLNGSIVSPTDTVQCLLSATDASGATASASASVIIANSLPVIDGIALSPATVYTDDTISAVVSSSDDDGDTISLQYEWFVDGNSVQSSNQNTLAGSLFTKHQAVYVVVTPNDGYGNGVAVSSSTITIANTLPQAPAITISPSPSAAMDDDLSCSIVSESSDMDNDAILYTFSWHDETGATVQTTALTAALDDVLVAANTSQGTWSCTVVPDDGDGQGNSVTATVVVEENCAYGELACPGLSCLDILDNGASTGDGQYWIDPTGSGTAIEVFCDMTIDGGGWTILADHDYQTDPCPGQWQHDSTEHLCKIGLGAAAASSAFFDSLEITYTEVLNNLTAKQHWSCDAFAYRGYPRDAIDDLYVDGIAMSYDNAGSRGYLYTWAIGYSNTSGCSECLCPANGGQSPAGFVTDYSCESGNNGGGAGIEWFAPLLFGNNQIVSPAAATSGDIEMRLIVDQADEDVGILSLYLGIR